MQGLQVRVSVGDEQYAIPVDEAIEVLVIAITEVPGTAPEVRGVCNVRGELLPVFDLARLIGIPGDASGQVLVVEHAGQRAGLFVGAVSDVEALPPFSPEPSKFVDGKALVGGQLVGELSLVRTFEAMEHVTGRG